MPPPPPPGPSSARDTPASGTAPSRTPDGGARRLLITAGPTHEPIDAVRYLGNRSSGRLGVALAGAAAARGWEVTLLLGPAPIDPASVRARVRRFVTTAELQGLLAEEFPRCDVLVMAAAVADYRPIRTEAASGADPSEQKLRRSGGRMTLELESTPDLLAECARRRAPGQVLVGFALEPAERLMTSAQQKLERKGLDAIVANPLATMDSPTIEATVLRRDGSAARTPGLIPKDRFAEWLLDVIGPMTGQGTG